MTKPFKPMLAASIDSDAGESIFNLQYPVHATPKIDGIRCLMINGEATSRSLKPIANDFIRETLRSLQLQHADGELLVGDNFQQATSGIMSSDGRPDFRYYVFDHFQFPEHTYEQRMASMRLRFGSITSKHIKLLFPVILHDAAALDHYTQGQLALGLEGVMVRSPHGRYKHGRATFNEGLLTKIKPFEDAEATIVDFEEQMHNGNVATTNALGRTERSSHKSGLTGKGTLGALVVDTPKWGRFNIGTGFNDAQRRNIWNRMSEFRGQVVKFQYQAIGTKDKPRIPSFLGFRDHRDISV